MTAPVKLPPEVEAARERYRSVIVDIAFASGRGWQCPLDEKEAEAALVAAIARALAPHDEAARRPFRLQAAQRGYARAAAPLEIPWSVAEKAWAAYRTRYGYGCQTLERLAERGGFGVEEMDDLYPAWREEVSDIARLTRALAAAESRSRALAEALGEIVAIFDEVEKPRTTPLLREEIQRQGRRIEAAFATARALAASPLTAPQKQQPSEVPAPSGPVAPSAADANCDRGGTR